MSLLCSSFLAAGPPHYWRTMQQSAAAAAPERVMPSRSGKCVSEPIRKRAKQQMVESKEVVPQAPQPSSEQLAFTAAASGLQGLVKVRLDVHAYGHNLAEHLEHRHLLSHASTYVKASTVSWCMQDLQHYARLWQIKPTKEWTTMSRVGRSIFKAEQPEADALQTSQKILLDVEQLFWQAVAQLSASKAGPSMVRCFCFVA
jgi:hypothetical protein